MPQVVTCPQCAKSLQIGDALIGKMVQCPTCSQIFFGMPMHSAPPPAIPEPLLPLHHEAISLRLHHDGTGIREWQTVRIGVNLVLAATVVNTIASVFIAIIILAVERLKVGERSLGVILVLLVLSMGVGWVIAQLGQMLCLSAPAARGARNFALAALLATLLGFLLQFIGAISALADERARAPTDSIRTMLAAQLGTLLLFLGILIFVLFEQAVVRVANGDGWSAIFVGPLVSGTLALAVQTWMTFWANSINPPSPTTLRALLIVWAFSLFVFAVWNIFALDRVRHVIAERLYILETASPAPVPVQEQDLL